MKRYAITCSDTHIITSRDTLREATYQVSRFVANRTNAVGSITALQDCLCIIDLAQEDFMDVDGTIYGMHNIVIKEDD